MIILKAVMNRLFSSDKIYFPSVVRNILWVTMRYRYHGFTTPEILIEINEDNNNNVMTVILLLKGLFNEFTWGSTDPSTDQENDLL